MRACARCGKPRKARQFRTESSEICTSCRTADSKKRVKEWLREYKESLPCAKCGEKFLYSVVQFHHRPSEIKLFRINQGYKRGWGKKKLLSEIVKCDLLCANCHAEMMKRS